MEKQSRNDIGSYTYNDSGMAEVAQQVLDSYHNGFVDVEENKTLKEE